MIVLVSLAVGVIYAVAVLLLLQGSLWRLLAGLALLSHGAHLLILAGGGLVTAAPPLVSEGALAPAAGSADPLPQALVLTAIVIAFAVLSFALVLGLRAGTATGRDDLESFEEDLR